MTSTRIARLSVLLVAFAGCQASSFDGALPEAGAGGEAGAGLASTGGREAVEEAAGGLPIIDRTEIIAEAEAERAPATEVEIVHDGEPGSYAEVLGLPAISLDGRTVAMDGYDEVSDTRTVQLIAVRTGRARRAIVLDGPDGTPPSALRALERELAGGEYLPLVALESHYDEGDDSGETAWFTGTDLRVDFDGETGAITVANERGEVIGTARARAQVPNGPGVGLMDPEAARLPMMPNLTGAFLSPDATQVIAILSACDCACDIEPYPRSVGLTR